MTKEAAKDYVMTYGQRPKLTRKALSDAGGAIDHIDGDPTNNSRENLRIVDIREKGGV